MDKKLKKSNVQDIFELRTTQRGMLYQYLRDKDQNSYHAQFSLAIEGIFDSDTLRRAFEIVQSNNGVLRSVFRWEKLTRPLQIVLKECPLDFSYSDISGETDDGLAALIEKHISAIREKRFDLADLAFRVSLVKISISSFLLNFSHHHILYDGWSTGIILTELFTVYGSLRRGKTVHSISKPSYKKVHELITSNLSEETNMQHWRTYLDGFSATPFISTNVRAVKEPEPIKKYRFKTKINVMRSFASSNLVTQSAVVYSVFAILLLKYLNSRDVVFGIAVSNRDPEIAGIDKVIGNLINTIPLRVSAPEKTVLVDIVKKVHQDLVVNSGFTNTSYADIKELLELKHAENLFDIVLVGQNYPLNEKLINLNEEFNVKFHSSYESTEFPLMINIFFNQELEIDFAYKEGDIGCSQIKLMAEHFTKIMEYIIKQPDDQIGNISFSNEKEMFRNSIINELSSNNTKRKSSKKLLPASFHQERLWFIDQFEKGYLYDQSPIYHNIPLIVDIQGELDIKILTKSIREIIRRHAVLRTQVIGIDQKPYQRISENIDFKLRHKKIRRGTTNFDDIIRSEIDEPFELDANLIRSTLYESGNKTYKLVFVVHHIIADRPAMLLLTKEVLSVYKSIQLDINIENNDKLISYEEFSQWQHKPLEKLDFELVTYWKRQLGPKIKALEIPTDRPRAAVHTFTGASLRKKTPKLLLKKLEAYEKSSDIEPGIILMAAFKILLNKYARHEEIVIGTSVDVRASCKIPGAMGPLSNLIVLKSYVSPDSNFNKYVKNLSKIYKEGVKHGLMPFDRLVKVLNPTKDMGRTALFDILFEYDGVKTDTPLIEGLKVDLMDINLGYGKYDLNLFFQRAGNELSCSITYNLDYFNKSTIQVFIARLFELTKNLLSQPEERLSKISFLSEKEENRLLNLLDYSGINFPKEETIISLFVKQAALTPDSIAVQYENHSLTYLDLDRQSTRLAHLLKEKGAERHSIIGLFVDRSLNVVLGMLAILKVGGAYLPIDVDYPEERINYMIYDSKPNLILTTLETISHRDIKVPIVLFEELENSTAVLSKAASYPVPKDLCYIIYTSGTTGKPKGVMIEHRNIVRLFFNDKAKFQFGPEDVWTMFHSHCFDFSVWEIYGAILFGGRVVVIPKKIARNTKEYLKILRKEKVTVLNQTPSAFYNLSEEELVTEQMPLRLRYVIFGGEALNPTKLKLWKEKYPNVKLINMFGITETTVHVTYKEIGDYEIENNISNIGKPIPTVSAYVLDEHLNFLPEGIVGELYVSGAGIARGYLFKKELTRQKFIKSPFNAKETLYCTGDLVKILKNGDLEYCGRIDDQIQLRGFRIELGEIRSQLLKHEQIEEVVVTCQERGANKFLVAYYQSQEELEKEMLKNLLSTTLPDYMIPTYYMHLKRFGLTLNGKIDKSNLPDPEQQVEKQYAGPSNELEEALVAIWSGVLKMDSKQIGTKDSFFDLGGDSLNSTTLSNTIYKQLKVEIPLNQIFKLETITALSEYIMNERWITGELPKVSQQRDEFILD